MVLLSKQLTTSCQKKETGSIGDRVSRLHHCGVHLVKNVAAVTDSLAEDSELSIRCFRVACTFHKAPFGAFCTYSRIKFR